VVVTPQALEGIDASPGSELLLAADAAGFIETIAPLLAAPQPEIGAAARRCVEERYGWSANLACVDQLLDGTGQGRSAGMTPAPQSPLPPPIDPRMEAVPKC
jgi:hypothetical protein